MDIKGEFRDVLSRNGVVIEDRGWKSNEIVPDFGKFLAAVMKKDFTEPLNKDDPPNEKEPIAVGIEYMAVGSSSEDQEEKDRVTKFKDMAVDFFKGLNSDEQNADEPLNKNGNWIWIKKIERREIQYRDIKDTPVTNKLQVDVVFKEDIPKSNKKSLKFEEFALLGILKKESDGTFDIDKMFFINHAPHGVIEKERDMIITRTVKLTFPIKQEVTS